MFAMGWRWSVPMENSAAYYHFLQIDRKRGRERDREGENSQVLTNYHSTLHGYASLSPFFCLYSPSYVLILEEKASHELKLHHFIVFGKNIRFFSNDNLCNN